MISRCVPLQDCAAWSWHTDGGACFLKDNASPPNGTKINPAVTSGLKAGPTCVPHQQPSMCPGGTSCHDCGGPLCPCDWAPGPGPPPPASPPRPLVPACSGEHKGFKFCDPALPIEARVADLLARIPDATKPNLLTARGGPRGLQNFSGIGVPAYYWVSL